MKINKKIDNVYHIEFGLDDDRANARIYRYDTGQLIKFYDIPDDVEVQFSNEHSTNGTINKRITDSMVQIPDSLLTSKDNIIAYIKYIDENSETTTKLIKFGLLDRAKPGDYVSPDEEPSFRSFVEEQLKEAKETVEKNKDYLKETIENTEKSKEYMDATDANRRTVEGLTEKNKEYATQTENNAESANTSASNASESASNASQSASNAKGSADNASVSAKEAKDAAVKAGTSESNAKEAENNINSAVTEFEQTKRESLTEIGNLTTNSKKEISDLTDAKKTELNKINDDITQNAGELKEAIVNAADAKKEEINQKGLEVLQSLPEDMGKIQDTTLIKSTESGTEINLTDSSDMNIQELHLFGKSEQKTTKGIQLLNLKDAKGGTGEGVTYTINADGSVARKGTATGYVGNVWMRGAYYENTENKEIFLILEAGKTYYIKDVVLVNGQVNVTSKNKVESNYLVTINENEYPEGFKVTGIRNPAQTSGKTYNDIIYPIIAESSTAVDWEEYTGGQPSPNPDYPQEMNCVENPTVSVAGKNLLVNNAKSKQIRNLIYTVNEDKSISVKGTYEVGNDVTESDIYLFGTFKDEGQYVYIPKGRYSINTISVPSGIYIAREKTKGSLINSENIIKTLSEQDCYFYSWIFRITKDGTYNSTIYPQMEVGNTATEYEPYKEIQSAQPTCKLNGIDEVKDELIIRTDGTGQLIQRLLEEELNDNSDYVTWYANTNTYGFLRKESKWLFRANKINIKSNKLKGITKEVGNPGTYDKNGIFVDVAGLYIKISKKYLTEYTVDALKTYLRENPITVVGLLKEPIVTNLSAEEVQKILALHTNKPNTTIWNDQNAEMQITYVADTKSYIDKKFKELSDAIVASASEAE
nr:MAG TPA: hypothetical protein [Caudoviricetes sp.]